MNIQIMEIKQYIKENEARFMDELVQPHSYSQYQCFART